MQRNHNFLPPMSYGACHPHICCAGPLPSLSPTCPVLCLVLHSHFFYPLPLLSPVNTTLQFSSGSMSSCSPFLTFPIAPLVAAATPGISLLCQWPLSCWSLPERYQALRGPCIESSYSHFNDCFFQEAFPDTPRQCPLHLRSQWMLFTLMGTAVTLFRVCVQVCLSPLDSSLPRAGTLVVFQCLA